jgi:16S rRNA (uracil1498-N3)-methyltransferase
VDRVSVFDGEGRTAEAEIVSLSRNRVGISLAETHVAAKPRVEIVLAQAVLKGKAMDWLIQKAVELGVSAIQPLITEHAVVRPDDAKAEKWSRVALEACKQCGQPYLPQVREPVWISDFLKQEQNGLKIVAALSAPRRSLRDVVGEAEGCTGITFAVGPEGDFSKIELEALISQGFQPASLGSQVLRSETAALFGLSAFCYALT